ncbi:hypothetical protein Q5P01_000531 [Channa striata]|uniref:Uncharacterized protein n=1 Tax=Channa striata TaxID=64152 RepID=A0AA88LFU0_CHASR|nr:hypothetical protein Q5P01_000531 [Channa striata]
MIEQWSPGRRAGDRERSDGSAAAETDKKTKRLEAPQIRIMALHIKNATAKKKSAVERLIRSGDRLVEMHADLGR